MKKTLFALLGMTLLLAGCNKQTEYVPDQYVVIDYNVAETTIDVKDGGTLSPMAATGDSFDWISMTQSGTSVKFTTGMNVTGGNRTAIYKSTGGTKVIATQKSVKADIVLLPTVSEITGSGVVLNVNVSTSNPADYSSWGYAISSSIDRSQAKETDFAQKFVVGQNTVTVPISGDDPVYVWLYANVLGVSKIYTTEPLAVIKPVMVQAGEDLQAAILSSEEYAEIRVAGGATFQGPILVNGGRTVSGGWNADFSEQSLDNLTVIDGAGGRGMVIAADADGNPVDKTTTITFLEIKNCGGDGPGGAVLISGNGRVIFCNIHHNKTAGGGAGIFVTNAPHDVTVANCIIDSNYSTDAHAGGINVQTPASDNYSNFTLVNTLFTRNKGLWGGYASSLHVDSKHNNFIVNNTFTRNFDSGWGSGTFPGSQWAGAAIRGGCNLLLANNLVVGNYSTVNWNMYEACDEANLPRAATQFLIHNNDSFIYKAYNNFVEGCVMYDEGYVEAPLEDLNAHGADNRYFETGVSLNRFMQDAMNFNFVSAGDAKGNGVLNDDVKAILDKFPYDLAGNPRVTGGRIDIGCYQAQ